MNLTHRLLSSHLLHGELTPGEELHLKPDQILIEDATGSMAYLQFEGLRVERVAVPLAVMYVDHNVLQVDELNMDEHRFLQSFSARYGIKYSRPGNGISHSVHLERFARPGQLLLGADSHTIMAGAAGMFALGAGGLDVAAALAGHGVWIPCPSVVALELHGRLPDWVEAKDVVLELLRRYGVRGGYGKSFEFVGEGVETLSVMERGTICNMALETGATTAVFPSDERTREWLTVQGREDDFEALSADPGASYDEVEVVDLSRLEPLIAKPHSPGNIVPVREVEGTPVAQVCVGSSVNSSYEDLARVAAILRGSVVHPQVELTVTPGSRQILDAIARTDVYRDLVAAGARVLEAVCGPCIGIGQAPAAGVVSVRTFNRNFPDRSGTSGDEVYLCSPSTAAATALHAEITDPRGEARLPRSHRAFTTLRSSTGTYSNLPLRQSRSVSRSYGERTSSRRRSRPLCLRGWRGASSSCSRTTSRREIWLPTVPTASRCGRTSPSWRPTCSADRTPNSATGPSPGPAGSSSPETTTAKDRRASKRLSLLSSSVFGPSSRRASPGSTART
jgi:aconitate hydratase